MIRLEDIENDNDLMLLASAIKKISLEKGISVNDMVKEWIKTFDGVSHKCFCKEVEALNLAFLLTNMGFLSINGCICERIRI